MVAVLLVGIVAYRQLPVSALAGSRLPDDPGSTTYPGASPDVMASSVTAPLERQFGQMPGLQQMTSTSSTGLSIITLQFALELSIDVAEQEVQRRSTPPAPFCRADLPTPPIYSKIESGRRADSDAGAHVEHAAAVEGRRPRRHPSRAEDLAAARRRAGEHQRRPEAGRAHQANPTALASYGLNLEDLRTAVAATNVNQAKGSFDGPAAGLSDRRQRSAALERRLRAAGRRLPQRRAGPADRRRRPSSTTPRTSGRPRG